MGTSGCVEMWIFEESLLAEDSLRRESSPSEEACLLQSLFSKLVAGLSLT